MDWIVLDNESKIKELMNLYNNFEDAFLTKFEFDSGNFVDCDGVGYSNNLNKLSMQFQRMDDNPFSIEIVFEYLTKLNFFPPNWDGKYADIADINFAKIVKNDSNIYWTQWEDFDPYNHKHLNFNDFTLVEAKKAKWRMVSETQSEW